MDDEKYTIFLHPENQSFLCGKQEMILNSAIHARIKIPVGCKGGGCGICKMKVLSGKVDLGVCSKAVLTDEEINEGYILSCRAKPKSNVTMELVKRERKRTYSISK